MMRLKNIIGLLLVLIIAFGVQDAFSQARFSASAPKSVPVNSNFQITYTLENGNGNSLKPPAFSAFQFLGGPSQATNVSIVNNVMSQSVSYTYTLRPKSQGTFKIGK